MRRSLRLLAMAVVLLAGCGDGAAPQMTPPSAASPTATPSGTWLRLASFSADLEGAEVLLDGSILHPSIVYPTVTRYRRVDPGSHVVRFVPSGKTPVDERTVQLDATFVIMAGEAATIVAAGLVDTRTLTVAVLRDELGTGAEGVRLRLVHTMSDFPASLGLWLNSEMALVRNVGFLEDRGYRSAEPGNYPLEVRRTGTRGPLLPVVPFGLAGNATYTMFAFGTLRQGDLDQRLVLDATLGTPALRR